LHKTFVELGMGCRDAADYNESLFCVFCTGMRVLSYLTKLHSLEIRVPDGCFRKEI